MPNGPQNPHPSLEQMLSGSHKVLVEMQDLVAELLRTVPRESPATAVSPGGTCCPPHPILLFPSLSLCTLLRSLYWSLGCCFSSKQMTPWV